MRVNIQHRHYRGQEAIEHVVQSHLKLLGQRRTITEAFVRLEENPAQSPACSVLVHLVTPGPDIVVQASDHSLAAAWMKADAKLHECIDARERKQAARFARAPRRALGSTTPRVLARQ